MQSSSRNIHCKTIQPTRSVPDIGADVRRRLLNKPRTLSPKYFYDARGSDLFTRICDTPEYYPTRTEESLLKEFSRIIIQQARPDHIIELGSGNAQKTRHLFEACQSLGHQCSYSPFDVCKEILLESSEALKLEYPWLEIMPLQGDFHAGLGNLPETNGRCLFVFLGGSIGNFTPEESHDFLQEIHAASDTGDYFLLGADRKKEPSVLQAAYNDAEGITAEFNLNILQVLNKELDADFSMNNFEHLAQFNDALERIEMHLISKKQQSVEIDDLNETIQLEKGEKILTEISCKYTYEKLESLLENSGFSIENHFQPENEYFSLVLTRNNNN